MSVDEEYAPSPSDWVREQVEEFERSGGTAATTLRGTDMPVVVMTMRGHKSGKIRKVPVMKVEHDGVYAAVASQGGAPTHPLWYHNLLADPDVTLQDGTVSGRYAAREVHGEEKALWWQRAVAAFPNYAQYQARTEREIPLLLLE